MKKKGNEPIRIEVDTWDSLMKKRVGVPIATLRKSAEAVKMFKDLGLEGVLFHGPLPGEKEKK